MSIGLERFESGWKGNDAYINNFIDSQLDSAGYSFIGLVSLDTATNAARVIGVLPVGIFGQKIVATVTVPLGASIGNVLLVLYYQDQTATIRGVNATFLAGSPTLTCKVPGLIPTNALVALFTSVSCSPNPSGTILVSVPQYLSESFIQSEWPSATPGL